MEGKSTSSYGQPAMTQPKRSLLAELYGVERAILAAKRRALAASGSYFLLTKSSKIFYWKRAKSMNLCIKI